MPWHIGIDPGSRSIGLAAINDDGELRHQAYHVGGEVPDRLVRIRRYVRRWVQALADEGVWNVVIEQPGTRFGGAVLLGSFGVILEATRSVLPRTVVHELTSASWKRIALGDGAAKKPDVMKRARELGYTGSWQDVADAVCIAEAARVLAEQAKEAA